MNITHITLCLKNNIVELWISENTNIIICSWLCVQDYIKFLQKHNNIVYWQKKIIFYVADNIMNINIII